MSFKLPPFTRCVRENLPFLVQLLLPPLYSTYILVKDLNNRALETQNNLSPIFWMHWSNFHNAIKDSYMDEFETSDDSKRQRRLASRFCEIVLFPYGNALRRQCPGQGPGTWCYTECAKGLHPSSGGAQPGLAQQRRHAYYHVATPSLGTSYIYSRPGWLLVWCLSQRSAAAQEEG